MAYKKPLCRHVSINRHDIFVTKLEGEGDDEIYGGGQQAYHVVVSGGSESKYHTGDRKSSEQFIRITVAEK